MLVRFRSPANADIIMFGTVATRLLDLMGMSGRIPSAIQAEDLPAVHDRLLAGLTTETAPATTEDEAHDENAVDSVPLRNRAQPLLKMIDAAIRRGTYVMWEKFG